MKKMKEIIKYTKKLKLLYVEDEKILREISSELFKNFFDDITLAVNGLEALELYSINKYDLIITDIFMPKMNGIELIKNIRKNNNKILILIFSALKDPSYMTASESLGVDGYILKPLSLNNMINALEKLSYKLIHSKDITFTKSMESIK